MIEHRPNETKAPPQWSGPMSRADGPVPFEDRQRALEAAKQSYLETALGLGYEEATALRWAEAVMFRLQFTQAPVAA